ncbi:hypothetical protein DAKH74_034070 [Maudiozyma humilis]|uniref:FAS1 domain-containing protein n=1 Tax=Maudiozyma humilis TaxID=51915 RepID=A0AAV5RZE8_MAUHU|nr:hypothetical protein DAKH74_034070 [Kazachstania humilis]
MTKLGKLAVIAALLSVPVLGTDPATQEYTSPSVNVQGGKKDSSDDDEPDFPFTTVVDILSQDVQFSTFLRIVQRSGNIIYLNELQNYTLFAPVNSAFTDVDTDALADSFDIENYILHERMLHTDELVNKTLLVSDGVKFPFVLGQAWDAVTETHFKVNKVPIVEADLTPNFQNATLHAIMDRLPDAQTLVQTIDGITQDNGGMFDDTFENVKRLMDKVPRAHSYLEGNTIIVPSDDSFGWNMNSIEINYLLDTYDKLEQMKRPVRERWSKHMGKAYKNMILRGIHGGSIPKHSQFENMNELNISLESDHFGVSHKIGKNMRSLASNEIFDTGIVHFFDNYAPLTNGIRFDAETYLHGLNCSGFVAEMYFRDIQNMIQGDKEMTIFVPDSTQNDDIGFTKSTLLYHFVEEHIVLEDDFPVLNRDETYTKMIDSAFCSSDKRLGGNCQRMKITKQNTGYKINSKLLITQTKPYRIRNTLIYTFSGELNPPGDLILSIPPLAHCSKSIGFLRQINLLELKPNGKGYSIFLPCFDSWTAQSLTMEYVQKNITVMEDVMKNFILDGIYYTDMDQTKSATHNLLGDTVNISSRIMHDENENMKVKLSTLPDELVLQKNSDVFFNQGVLHPVKFVDVPSSVDISVLDLIGVTGSDVVVDYIRKFEALSSRIFNPDPDAELYSLLIPTFSSLGFEDININSTKLERFLKMHILRGNETQNILDCSGDAKTDLGSILECRRVSNTETFLKIKDGADNEVRVLKSGCSTRRNGDSTQKACVFLIDRPISLSWVNRYNYHFSFPLVAIGIGAIIGVGFIMSLMCCVVVLNKGQDHKRQQTILPDEEQGIDENDVRRPLLSGSISNVRHYNSQNRMIRTPQQEREHDSPSRHSSVGSKHFIPTTQSSIARGYSENSTCMPMNVSQ